MNNLGFRWGKHLVFAGLLAFNVSTARADENTPFSDMKFKDTMASIERRGDQFEDKLEAALDNSSLDGSNV